MKDTPLGNYMLPVYSYERERTGVISRLGNFLYFPKSRFLTILYYNIFKVISLFFQVILSDSISISSFDFFSLFITYVFWKTDPILLSWLIIILCKLSKRDLSPLEPEERIIILDISRVLILMSVSLDLINQMGQGNGDIYCEFWKKPSWYTILSKQTIVSQTICPLALKEKQIRCLAQFQSRRPEIGPIRDWWKLSIFHCGHHFQLEAIWPHETFINIWRYIFSCHNLVGGVSYWHLVSWIQSCCYKF